MIITEGGNRVRVTRKHAPSIFFHDHFYSLATMRIWTLILFVVFVNAFLLLALSGLIALKPEMCKLNEVEGKEKIFITACKGVFFGGISDSKEVGCAAFNLALTLMKTLINSVLGMALYARLTTGRKRYHTIKASDQLNARISKGEVVIEGFFVDMRSRQLLGVSAVAFFIDAAMRVTFLPVATSGSLLTGLRITHVVNEKSPLFPQVPDIDVIDQMNRNFKGQIVIVIWGDDPRSGPAEFRRSYASFTSFPTNNPWVSDHLGVTIDYSAI